jgi:hypothetical protein
MRAFALLSLVFLTALTAPGIRAEESSSTACAQGFTHPVPRSLTSVIDRLDQDPRAESFRIFNDPAISAQDPRYDHAVETWPDDTAIWPLLSSVEARRRFAAYVLAHDPTDRIAYVASQTGIAPKSCAVDPAHPFECTHFSRLMHLKYRFADVPASFHGTDPRYQFERAPLKLRMPIREVEQMGKYDEVYHAVNAVFVGDGPALTASADAAQWTFFEPQNDRILSAPGRASTGMYPTGWRVHPDAKTGLDENTLRNFVPAPKELKQSLVFATDDLEQLHGLPIIKDFWTSLDLLHGNLPSAMTELITTQENSETQKTRQEIVDAAIAARSFPPESLAALLGYNRFLDFADRRKLDFTTRFLAKRYFLEGPDLYLKSVKSLLPRDPYSRSALKALHDAGAISESKLRSLGITIE